MKMKKNGQATYIEYERYEELWSYESMVVRYFPEEKLIAFGKDYDYGKTTASHITKWFRDYLGVSEMDSPKKREKAIESEEVEINGRVFKVQLLES